MLENMTRVIPAQLPCLNFKENSRYQPVKKGGSFGGIVCLVDRSPSEPRELITPSIPAPVTAPSGTEAAGPSPTSAAAPATSQEESTE